MQTELRDDGEISIVAVLSTIVRARWTILAWTLGIGAFAAINALQMPLVYKASVSFATQGASQSAGLGGLAGQLGLANPGAPVASSPELLIMLMKSPVLLSKVVGDTFVVPELGGGRRSIYEILGINGGDPAEREQRAMDAVKSLVAVDKQPGTGLVRVNVATTWPGLSLSLVASFVDAVETYNRESRRSLAAVERQFVEGRLAEAALDLRYAEDRLQRFLAANRDMSPTSQLAFERERLDRVVQLKQEVYVTLATNHEEARIREIRDTPVITVIEPPRVMHNPEPRKRGTRVVLGLLIGAFIGIVVTLLTDAARRLFRHRSSDTAELLTSLKDAKTGLKRALRFGR